LVNDIGTRLLDGLFPHYCALCGLRSRRHVPLCPECESEMPVNHHCCVRCAIPLPPTGAPCHTARLCGSCLQNPPPFDRVIAPWLYDEYLAHLIHQWKFHRERRMTALLAALWQQRAEPPFPVDLLVPVPLHWRRRWQRGFNQSELLCRQLLATCPELESAKLAHRLVRRQRPTAAQSGMSALQRASNLKGAFTVCRPCNNLRIAIVDDVLTTGATAAAVAAALATAGASYLEVWCLARTPSPGA
jgi:ComF family protein